MVAIIAGLQPGGREIGKEGGGQAAGDAALFGAQEDGGQVLFLLLFCEILRERNRRIVRCLGRECTLTLVRLQDWESSPSSPCASLSESLFLAAL